MFSYTNLNIISNHCLVLLDLHFWKYLIDAVILNSRNHPQIYFLLRPHPKSQLKVIKYLRQFNLPQNVGIDTSSSLINLLKIIRPKGVVAGPTGGLLDFALSFYPCFLYASEKSFEMNPLAFNSSSIQRIDDSQSSWNEFAHKFASPSKIYVKSVYNDACEHVTAFGRQSDSLLKSYIVS
jgi:hypothetical protein